MASLILIRGLPGSGKSTMARRMSDMLHLEADMFFHLAEDGKTMLPEYRFDPAKLPAAHKWCQDMTLHGLRNNRGVVVANTFTTVKELRPYFDIARAFGIVPTVVVAQGNFKSVHGVPDEALKRMRDRFQWDISELYR
ncbi:MAG: ATP-binding protein [Fischerella sp.]|nr:ATP-binding protein [Fischerella sp.]